MANLWLWFPNAEERRQYVISLLGLETVDTEVVDLRDGYLSALEEGKTRSPWYRLERLFYMDKTEKYQWQEHDFMEVRVWEKGFRRIYTQNSYYFRPGHWLVLKLRNNRAGRLVRKHVEETFPSSRLGTKVPLPTKSEMFLQLREVRNMLIYYGMCLGLGQPKPKLLQAAYKEAEEIMLACPHLFRGDDIYLWESMAGFWQRNGDLRKAERCWRNMARLQPGKTDAWLNLGFMFSEFKMWGPAVKAYLEGLIISPKDRYIKHNLSNILSNELAVTGALRYVQKLAVKEPTPLNKTIESNFLHLLGQFRESCSK